jgi:hypothetical protein
MAVDADAAEGGGGGAAADGEEDEIAPIEERGDTDMS